MMFRPGVKQFRKLGAILCAQVPREQKFPREKRQSRLKEPKNHLEPLVPWMELVAKRACLLPKNIQVGLTMVAFALVSCWVLLGFSGQRNVEEGVELEHSCANSLGEFLYLLLGVG